MSQLYLTVYSDKSFVLRSPEVLKQYKEKLKGIGGKYNPNLIGGPAWIFPNSRKPAVIALINELGLSLSEKEENVSDSDISPEYQTITLSVIKPVAGKPLWLKVRGFDVKLDIISVTSTDGIVDTAKFSVSSLDRINLRLNTDIIKLCGCSWIIPDYSHPHEITPTL